MVVKAERRPETTLCFCNMIGLTPVIFPAKLPGLGQHWLWYTNCHPCTCMIQHLPSPTVPDGTRVNQLPPPGFAIAEPATAEPDLPSSSLQVSLVHDLARLRARTTQWQRLATTAIEPNSFYEPWFLLPALEHLADTSVAVAIVEAPLRVCPDERRILCGLFPLQRRRRLRGWPVSNLEMWQHDHCYLTTPLVRRDVARETIAAFLDWQLRDRSRLWHLPQLSSAGPVDNLLTDLLACRNQLRVVRDRHARAVVLRRETAESVMHVGMTRKRRHEIRRLNRKLNGLGSVTIEHWESGVNLAEWIEDFLRLESAGWKGRQQTALGQSRINRHFFESMMGQAAAAGRLQMLRMQLDHQTIALKVNLRAGDGAFCFKIAYDERLARYSPGVLLEIANLDRLHQADSEIRWMDSCASARHPMIDSLWPDRRHIESVIVPGGRRGSKLAAAMLPVLRATKMSLGRPANNPSTHSSE